MTLLELITKVKDETLSREDLEKYRDQLSNLFSSMQLEMATLEKGEARFMAEPRMSGDSVAQRKVAWKGLPSGQRLIELKRYALATKEMINSLKSRIYDKIY